MHGMFILHLGTVQITAILNSIDRYDDKRASFSEIRVSSFSNYAALNIYNPLYRMTTALSISSFYRKRTS